MEFAVQIERNVRFPIRVFIGHRGRETTIYYLHIAEQRVCAMEAAGRDSGGITANVCSLRDKRNFNLFHHTDRIWIQCYIGGKTGTRCRKNFPSFRKPLRPRVSRDLHVVAGGRPAGGNARSYPVRLPIKEGKRKSTEIRLARANDRCVRCRHRRRTAPSPPPQPPGDDT